MRRMDPISIKGKNLRIGYLFVDFHADVKASK